MYPNKCACNEYDALIRRHGLPDVRQYEPGNLYMHYLSEILVALATQIAPLINNHVIDHDGIMKQTRASIKKRYEKAYANIMQGRLMHEETSSTLTGFVKFEKTSESNFLEKNKPPRLIQFRSYEYLYLLKSYVLQHSLFIKESDLVLDQEFYGQKLKTIFTKTYTNPELADMLLESWNEFKDPVAICLDHSKFDGHYCTELLDLEHMYWDRIFNSKKLRKLLRRQINNKGFTQNGLKFKMKGKRASGEYTTSEGNTTMNYGMLLSICKISGIRKARIHVNGDDSVIICERAEHSELSDNLWQFNNFNMETTLDIVATQFQEISFCQCKPIRVMRDGVLVWTMIRDPIRTMSRASVTETKFEKCISRYLASIGLCNLAVNAGVPILQAFSLWLINKSQYDRPLGAIDKYPAKLSGSDKISIQPITDEVRYDFETAFGYTPQQQIEMEDRIAGTLLKDAQSFKAFIKKYEKFHTN